MRRCHAWRRLRSDGSGAYSGGLRLREACRLRPTDIDSRRNLIRVEQGKGRKDRYTLLPPLLLETLPFG